MTSGIAGAHTIGRWLHDWFEEHVMPVDSISR